MNMMDRYNTMTFAQIWDDSDVFEEEYKESCFYDYTAATQSTPANYHNSLTDKNIEITFALLYSRYGNSPIANADVNQFKYKVFSIIFQYGPTWQKKLELQDNFRNLSKEDLMQGSKAIYNHAFNDASDPGTQTLTELQYINDQNTTNYKRSEIEAYSLLWEALTTDITSEYLDKFRKLFKTFVAPEFGPRIMSDIDEED